MKNKNIFRHLPQDLGRVVCSILPLIYRMKRLTVSGENYKGKLKGGMIIVSNHTGFSDPFIMGTCFWYRRLFFLAAKEVMVNKIVSLLLKGMGCIRIDRDISDIDAVRKCVTVLREGKLLGMFPQGGIKTDGGMESIKSGAVLIALQAGVPILPVYSRKRKNFLSRQKIIIGEPFIPADHCAKRFPSVSDIENISGLLLEKMKECKEAYDKN